MKKLLIIICLLFLMGCPIPHSTGTKEGKKANKNVLEMEQGQVIQIKNWRIIKVPGGWIYQYNTVGHTGVFVKDIREVKK